ncbi:uncharacterized protein LOC110712206 [Chenopodium quinoa]|uniref:uncharacterized protein LOC110712206 n=1 Tax=Chenopodium quinoa TaxID=63459 RepID=UPI000B79889A|nr:uncharacterized protein LOC110712206 [Chenopodium quinoa]
MNLSTYCCHNPLPPSSPLDRTSSSSSPSKKYFSYAPRKGNENKSSWRSQKLMAIATTIVIGLEVGDILSNDNGNYSMASELEIESHLLVPKNDKKRSVTRWSDKRMCPPWNINSLETIVPENLPRPSFHRKWEGVSLSPKSAPSVKLFLIKPRKNCFSL